MLTLKSIFASLYLITKYEWFRLIKISIMSVAVLCGIYFWGAALGAYYTASPDLSLRENFERQHRFFYGLLYSEYVSSSDADQQFIRVSEAEREAQSAELDDLFRQVVSPSKTLIITKDLAGKVVAFIFVFSVVQLAFGLMVLIWSRELGGEITSAILRASEILPKIKLHDCKITDREIQLAILYDKPVDSVRDVVTDQVVPA